MVTKYEPLHEKPPFCTCETKGTDQLHGNLAAFHTFAFATWTVLSLLFLNPTSKPLASFLVNCTALCVSALVGSSRERFFSHDTAHILCRI